MGRFESLFNKHVEGADYEYNPNETLGENEKRLVNMACLKHSSQYLYKELDGTFGEEYANYILTNILERNFRITGFNKFAMPEYKHITDKVLLVDKLKEVYKTWRYGNFNLINFFSVVVREVVDAAQRGCEIELYDFFLCLGLYIEKWKITNYPSINKGGRVTSAMVRDAYMTHIAHSLYNKLGSKQLITLSVMDEYLFRYFTSKYDYSIYIEKDNASRVITINYDMYMTGVSTFFEIIKESKITDNIVPPAVKIYTLSTNKVGAEILEYLMRATKLDIGVIHDIFKHVNFDAHPQWLKSPEYKEAMKELLRLARYVYTDINYVNIERDLKEIFSKDYYNYLNITTKRLAYTLNELKLETFIPSVETIYYKKNYANSKSHCKPICAEVTIDAKFITEGCTSPEEFESRLYKATTDAHTINLIRTSVPWPKGRKPTGYILNVKLDGIETDLISLANSIMSKATEYMHATYSLPFTYEISQRVFFRDKSKVCYLVL